MKFAGIFPPVVTPFQDEAVDDASLAFNILKWNSTGLAGYVALGSTGEFVHLSPTERDLVISTVREHATTEKIVIAGTGALSTGETIRLSRRAAELGADAALVITPFYYGSQMTGAALQAHYHAVADASPIPILLYNVPPFTHLNLELETVLRLAEHPNIVGMKDSFGSVEQLIQIIEGTPEDFILLPGTASVLRPALEAGASGAILAVANAAPELCMQIYDAMQTEPRGETESKQHALSELNATLGHYGIGGYKLAMDLRGYRGGPPRSPLLPPDETGRKLIREALKSAGL